MTAVKNETEAAVCPACHGKGKDGTTTCFYCEGSGIEPNGIRIAAQEKSEPMTYDLALPLTERNQGELVDSAQSRIRGIYELDQQIVGKVDALDDVRRRMKAVTNGLIVTGLPGKNEKERDAGLAKLLAEEKEYPDLMQQERQLHTELEQLRFTKEYLRRMHHLELALIQGEQP